MLRCRTSSELAAGRRSIGQHLVKPPLPVARAPRRPGFSRHAPCPRGRSRRRAMPLVPAPHTWARVPFARRIAAEIARTGMERAIDTAQEAWHSAGTAPASERSRGAGRRHLPPPAPPTPQRAAAAARTPGRIAAPPPPHFRPDRNNGPASAMDAGGDQAHARGRPSVAATAGELPLCTTRRQACPRSADAPHAPACAGHDDVSARKTSDHHSPGSPTGDRGESGVRQPCTTADAQQPARSACTRQPPLTPSCDRAPATHHHSHG